MQTDPDDLCEFARIQARLWLARGFGYSPFSPLSAPFVKEGLCDLHMYARYLRAYRWEWRRLGGTFPVDDQGRSIQAVPRDGLVLVRSSAMCKAAA